MFALSREMYQEVLDRALACDGTFMERLVYFLTSFADCIEKSGLKLCQEWVRNTVNPDLIKNEDDRGKLAFDIHSTAVLITDGMQRGEVTPDAPVEILAHTLMDVLYGQMLCWDMSGRFLLLCETNRGILQLIFKHHDDSLFNWGIF